MRTDGIKLDLKKLKRTIEKQPRILRFRGRRVVHASEWKYADWTKLPDSYAIAMMGFMINAKKAPPDWYRDYIALMERLKDPEYGRSQCWSCAIHQTQEVKKQIDREEKYWRERGGDKARDQHYRDLGEPYRTAFQKQDAVRHAEWRVFNELAGAQNRRCDVKNYFHCPYGEAWRQLQQDGHDARRLWEHIKWYDRHWNRDHTRTPPASDLRRFHFNERSIIDVTSYEDITRAITDGRLDKIIEEHERCMKENRPRDLGAG